MGGGVPGVWGRVGGGRGYTGTLPDPPTDPYLVIFQAQSPTHGRMKAILVNLMRFPEIWSRIDPEWTQNGPRMTLLTTLRTGPQMALR